MGATELIKQVAALPQDERTLFERLFRAMKNGVATPGAPTRSEWPDFRERLHRIYGDKIAPDSQHIIDDGRDDR
jgi:hypothetical protein